VEAHLKQLNRDEPSAVLLQGGVRGRRGRRRCQLLVLLQQYHAASVLQAALVGHRDRKRQQAALEDEFFQARALCDRNTYALKRKQHVSIILKLK
jgi:hypothetical protein